MTKTHLLEKEKFNITNIRNIAKQVAIINNIINVTVTLFFLILCIGVYQTNQSILMLLMGIFLFIMSFKQFIWSFYKNPILISGVITKIYSVRFGKSPKTWNYTKIDIKKSYEITNSGLKEIPLKGIKKYETIQRLFSDVKESLNEGDTADLIVTADKWIIAKKSESNKNLKELGMNPKNLIPGLLLSAIIFGISFYLFLRKN